MGVFLYSGKIAVFVFIDLRRFTATPPVQLTLAS